MCGLAAVFSKGKKKRRAGLKVIELFNSQRVRGLKGFGYLGITNGKLVSIGRSKDEEEIKSLLRNDKAQHILFHHRYPTSTKNTLGTTHPIFVSHKELKYDYYFAHNGVISNAVGLKTFHNNLGYVYSTEFKEFTVAKYLNGDTEDIEENKSHFNDSESLAIELARFIENISTNVGTTGAVAFWGISLKKGTDEVVDVYFGKNKGRDLCSKSNNKFYTISSETGKDIMDMKLFFFRIKDGINSLQERNLTIDKAEPATTQSTTQNTHNYQSANKYTPLSERDKYIYERLSNNFYTVEQVELTGLPEEAFFEGKEGYVPDKYLGKMSQERVKLPDRDLPFLKSTISTANLCYPSQVPDVKLIGSSYEEDKKALNLLNSYAEKYALIEKQHTDLLEVYSKGTISESVYDRRAQALESELYELEEKMSSLGISPEVVEEVVELAKEVLDYEDSVNDTKERYDLSEDEVQDYLLGYS